MKVFIGHLFPLDLPGCWIVSSCLWFRGLLCRWPACCRRGFRRRREAETPSNASNDSDMVHYIVRPRGNHVGLLIEALISEGIRLRPQSNFLLRKVSNLRERLRAQFQVSSDSRF